MNFTISTLAIDKQKSGILIAGVYEDKTLPQATTHLDKSTKNAIKTLLDQGDITGKLGQVLLVKSLVKVQTERVLLIGLGKKEKFNENNYISALKSAYAWLKERPFEHISLYLTDLELEGRDIHWLVKMAISQAYESFYVFDEFKQTKATPNAIKTIELFAPSAQEMSMAESAIIEGKVLGENINVCKNLGNMPPNVCTPEYIALQAKQLAKQHSKKLKLKVLDEKAIEKLGMGAFTAVTKGSAVPGKLIIFEYTGANKNDKPYALVGKGITFDTGGLSLKPAAGMIEMKYDMCGAASVFATVKAIAELNLPINLVAALACAENMPSSTATKPEDVVTTYSGQSVEILNTDAEGRLVLCDALSYMVDQYQPQNIIDVATLTGAVLVALGNALSGLFSNNDELTQALQQAATQSYDRLWPLPMLEDYQAGLESTVADMANISGDRLAMSSVAACFLSRFVKDTPWVHLDVAGSAMMSGKKKAATGRPVPLLVQYYINQANKA